MRHFESYHSKTVKQFINPAVSPRGEFRGGGAEFQKGWNKARWKEMKRRNINIVRNALYLDEWWRTEEIVCFSLHLIYFFISSCSLIILSCDRNLVVWPLFNIQIHKRQKSEKIIKHLFVKISTLSLGVDPKVKFFRTLHFANERETRTTNVQWKCNRFFDLSFWLNNVEKHSRL